MTDNHVHIGQFNEKYFYPEDVLRDLKEKGIDECWVSSTTSCIYCKESEAAQNNIEILKNAPSAEFLYENLRDEMLHTLDVAKEVGIKANPLFWVVPDIVFSGISLKRAIEDVPFKGFKIHPRGQQWNLEEKKIDELAANVFSLSSTNNFRILIHTGVDESDNPKKFEKYISLFPNVNVQLAHCKNVPAMKYMLEKYPNVTADSSCTNLDTIAELKSVFGENRIVFGSDSPVINLFSAIP